MEKKKLNAQDEKIRLVALGKVKKAKKLVLLSWQPDGIFNIATVNANKFEAVGMLEAAKAYNLSQLEK